MTPTTKVKKMHSMLRLKNRIIEEKVHRIHLLEDKLQQLRHRYFELKYPEATIDNPHPRFF